MQNHLEQNPAPIQPLYGTSIIDSIGNSISRFGSDHISTLVSFVRLDPVGPLSFAAITAAGASIYAADRYLFNTGVWQGIGVIVALEGAVGFLYNYKLYKNFRDQEYAQMLVHKQEDEAMFKRFELMYSSSRS